MVCYKHTRYKGKMKPRVLCEACWREYIRTQNSKGWVSYAKAQLNKGDKNV